jgi:hypothetical protein
MGRMGAWGIGIFDDDDAADWAWELEESLDLELVRDALAATMDTGGYLERPEGARALAAAAVVAATFDGDLRALPEEVGQWVDEHADTATRGDARLAVDALDRVMSEDSELRILWAEAPEGPRWVAEMERLRQRLERATGDDPGGG